jgi:hypothetical protein
MQSFISYLIEKRKHEDKFEELTPLDQLQKYAPHASNLYVSYTEIDKIGINPGSKYNTPNGIYTYQLDWLLKHFKNIDTNDLRDVPHAGDGKFAWVIQPTTDVLLLNSYNNIDEDIRKLRNYFSEMSDDEFAKKVREGRQEAKFNHRAAQIWNITRILANENPNKWNYLLRECLGYNIIRDNGLEIIHENEPYQTVFLSIKSFKVVDKIINKRSDSHLHINSSRKKNSYKNPEFIYMEHLQKFERFNQLVDRLIKTESFYDYQEVYNEFLKITEYSNFKYFDKITYLDHGLKKDKLKKLIEISIKNKFKNLLEILYYTPIGKRMISKKLISEQKFNILLSYFKKLYVNEALYYYKKNKDFFTEDDIKKIIKKIENKNYIPYDALYIMKVFYKIYPDVLYNERLSKLISRNMSYKIQLQRLRDATKQVINHET